MWFVWLHPVGPKLVRHRDDERANCNMPNQKLTRRSFHVWTQGGAFGTFSDVHHTSDKKEASVLRKGGGVTAITALTLLHDRCITGITGITRFTGMFVFATQTASVIYLDVLVTTFVNSVPCYIFCNFAKFWIILEYDIVPSHFPLLFARTINWKNAFVEGQPESLIGSNLNP